MKTELYLFGKKISTNLKEESCKVSRVSPASTDAITAEAVDEPRWIKQTDRLYDKTIKRLKHIHTNDERVCVTRRRETYIKHDTRPEKHIQHDKR